MSCGFPIDLGMNTITSTGQRHFFAGDQQIHSILLPLANIIVSLVRVASVVLSASAEMPSC
jgi:hypothetical protein